MLHSSTLGATGRVASRLARPAHRRGAVHRPAAASPSSSSMAAFWDSRATRYDGGASGAWHASIALALVDAADPQPGECVLDLGCGTGLATLLAAGRGAAVTGLDLSPQMVAVARAKAAAAASTPVAAGASAAAAAGRATFAVGDAQTLAGVPAASFDAVLASALVPFLPDPPSALARWREVLRPGVGRAAFHGFKSASVLGDLTVRAAASVGVALDFEKWTGSADACAGLLRQAGFSCVRVGELPIVDSHSVADAMAALPRMLCHPLGAPLAEALRADAEAGGGLFERLSAEYGRLVEGAAAADGRLHTAGTTFVAVGRA